MTDTPTEAVTDADQETYDGLPGALPYAFRTSESLLFKGYVALGVLLSLAITLLFVFGMVVILGATASVAGGTFTFSRAFFIFIGLLVVAPLLAPILLVARRHRRTGSSVRYDRSMALSALVFIGSLYVALVISAPPALREPTDSAVVGVLYALPQLAGLVPPLLAVGLMYLVHRWFRADVDV